MTGNPPLTQFTVWGSYDKGKPRVRMLLDALTERKQLASEINLDIWRGTEDKSIAGWSRILWALLRLIAGYPVALVRLALLPRTPALLLPYPAIVDIFVVWPLARMRGQHVVFDAFIPFHDTLVGDRGRLAPGGMTARALWQLERLALNLADLVIVDTDEHAGYFSSTFGIPRSRIITALVGAEPLFWESRSQPKGKLLPAGVPFRYVLFYGQLIPLHGTGTILETVLRSNGIPVHWLIVGSGQEEYRIRQFIQQHAPANMTWMPWVDYRLLPDLIRGASVCLGIFGSSDKAARVIPNKMFQVLAAGGSIITRESPAVATLARRFPDTIQLVPPADADALLQAVKAALDEEPVPIPLSARECLSPARGIDALIQIVDRSAKAKQCA